MSETTAADAPAAVRRERGELLWLCGAAALLFAGLLVYSQTLAFAWDEGFHLLAAQLINAGKRPYLDFCFPQTPLNAYLNAGWMRIFGETWRATHVLATLWVAGAAFLAGEFVLARLPAPRWRLAGAVAAAAAVGLNSQVVLFGTIGQAYGFCLFLTVAAFRLAVVAVERRAALWAAATGLMAGAAAASSLLTAAAGPVLLVWIVLRNRAGNRWIKLAAFLAGGAIPFVSVIRLYALGPRQVLFNIVQYQTLYRRVKWEGATGQDISVLTGWIDSAQGLALILLAAAGVWFLARKSGWDGARRAEFYLAMWLGLALTAELGLAHPTFERYFLLVAPFAAIPAVAGLYWIGSRVGDPERPMRPALILIIVLALGLWRAIYDDFDSYSWKDCEKIAEQVDAVTPRGGTLWADELFYFLTRRPPPDGMEFSYAHELDLPADQAALLHILPVTEIHRRVRAGAYQTVAACYESDATDKLNLPQLYLQRFEVKDCPVYWEWAGKR